MGKKWTTTRSTKRWKHAWRTRVEVTPSTRRLFTNCAQDADIEEHKFGMVEQCQKLLKLDAATEEALVKQYPQPELLLPKVEPRSKEERAARKKPPKATGAEKEALEAKFGKKKKRGKKGRA